jgi:transposase
MRYIPPLTAEEHQCLSEGHRNSAKPHFRHRCQCILLSAEGYSVPELARLFKVGRRTIYTWFNRFEQYGITGLMIQPGRGSKAKLQQLDETQIQWIKTTVEHDPQQLDLVCETLTGALGFTVSRDMLKRFLKKTLVTAGNDSVSV